MAVVVRQRLCRFAENQLLITAHSNPRDAAIDVLSQGIGRFHQFHVELANPGCGARLDVKFHVRNAQDHPAEFARLINAILIAPWAGGGDVAIICAARAGRAFELAAFPQIGQALFDAFEIWHHQADMAA